MVSFMFYIFYYNFKNLRNILGNFLVVQGLRFCLPVSGVWV